DRVPYSLCAAFPHIVGESEGATSVRSHNLEATIGGATARKAEIVQEHWDSNQLSIGLQRATLCEFCAKEPRTHDVIKYPRLRFGVCLCIGIPNNLAVGQLQFQLSANRVGGPESASNGPANGNDLQVSTFEFVLEIAATAVLPARSGSC